MQLIAADLLEADREREAQQLLDAGGDGVDPRGLVTAALGIVYQPIGIVGVFRLATPGSWWSRHLYGPTSRRRARSDRRFGEQYLARLDRWRDIVGGAPADQP